MSIQSDYVVYLFISCVKLYNILPLNCKLVLHKISESPGLHECHNSQDMLLIACEDLCKSGKEEKLTFFKNEGAI